MTIAELLIPRCICVSPTGDKYHYPASPYKIGEILTKDDRDNVIPIKYEGSGGMFFSELKRYPYLFKELHWWQHRNIEDLPLFVKTENKVYAVEKWEPSVFSNEFRPVEYGLDVDYSRKLFEKYEKDGKIKEWLKRPDSGSLSVDWHQHHMGNIIPKCFPATEAEYIDFKNGYYPGKSSSVNSSK
jgi:hypothetical protein